MPAAATIENTFGALLLGSFLSVLLYGMSVVQCLYYFTHYPKDVWYLRLLVAAVFIFDSMPPALVMHSMYEYLIKNFDNPAFLGRLVWSLLIEVVFAALIALLVQGFYTVRVWRMSKSYLLTGLITMLSLTEFGLCVVWLARAMPMKTFVQLLSVSKITRIANSIQAAVDTIIAVSLVYMLNKSRTGFKETDAIINKLIFFFVNTGLATSMCALAVVIATVLSPNSLIYAAWYFCIGRLYTNSLLAALNAREVIHKHHNIDISLPSVLARMSGSTTAPPNISVVIDSGEDRQTEGKVDADQAMTEKGV